MAQTATTVRMDKQQKAQFDKLCEQFGMSANTAINIFVKAVIRSKSIPFSIQAKNEEYDEVLHRAKFKLSDDQICTVIELVKQNGIDSSRFPYAGEMPDEDDRVFYEVCLSKEDSFLVTGNLKHFPKEPQVITAAEMMEILDNEL